MGGWIALPPSVQILIIELITKDSIIRRGLLFASMVGWHSIRAFVHSRLVCNAFSQQHLWVFKGWKHVRPLVNVGETPLVHGQTIIRFVTRQEIIAARCEDTTKMVPYLKRRIRWRWLP